MVRYILNSSSGSLKDGDLFRRFFICMNYETRLFKTDEKLNSSSLNSKIGEKSNKKLGLYIQYGIIEGQDSNESVYLSYFDENPLETRYYMFGRYLYLIFIYFKF